MKNIYFLSLVLVLTYCCISYPVKAQPKYSSELFVKYFEYKTLSSFQRKIFDDFVNEEFPQGSEITATLNEHSGTRNKMRLAEALFFRNKANDVRNAVVILKWVISMQNLDAGSKNYGCFKGGMNETGYDFNMREFIGTDLIIIYHKYKNKLPADLKNEMKDCFIRNVRGDMMRNVNPDYNNISIMSSFMLDYIGSEFNLPDVKEAGLLKAKAIFANFNKYNTLCEYNSPTYYGVDFVGLALWRELAADPQLKQMGAVIEKELWLDIAQFYNANLQNISGPYLRSYGIDMKKYNAILGVWIAAAVNDPTIAGVPGINGAHNESNFIIPVFDLGISMPVSVLAEFKKFSVPRFILRTTSNYYEGDRLKKVTANIQKNWMMGGLWGNRKVSHILRTGTMHWKSTDGDIGWLIIPGEGKTNVVVDEKQMKIFLADSLASEFEIWVYSKNNNPDNYTNIFWSLPNMQIGIATTLERASTIVLDAKTVQETMESDIYYPNMIKLVYHIPPAWNFSTPLITLTPSCK